MRVRGPDGKVISFPDDTPPDTIKAVMARQYGGPQGQGAPPMAMSPGVNPAVSAGIEARNKLAGWLPGVGGFAGGVAGTLAAPPFGGIPGAYGGGAAGEAIRRRITGEPMDPQALVSAGANQGMLEIGGAGIAAGGRALARPVMQGALGVSRKLMQNFPDAVETTLRKGIPVSKGGIEKASRLREQSAQALSDLLDRAKASGMEFRSAQVTRHVRALIRDRAIPSSKKEALMGELVEFLQDKGKRIDPPLLQEIKKYYQEEAKNLYGAGGVEAARPTGRLFAKKMALGAREQLEAIPGVAARNRETQSLIGAQRAVEAAASKPPPVPDITKPTTWPVVSSVTNPYMSGQVARALNSRAFRQLSRQSPRLAAELARELTQSEEPDATGVSP